MRRLCQYSSPCYLLLSWLLKELYSTPYEDHQGFRILPFCNINKLLKCKNVSTLVLKWQQAHKQCSQQGRSVFPQHGLQCKQRMTLIRSHIFRHQPVLPWTGETLTVWKDTMSTLGPQCPSMKSAGSRSPGCRGWCDMWDCSQSGWLGWRFAELPVTRVQGWGASACKLQRP